MFYNLGNNARSNSLPLNQISAPLPKTNDFLNNIQDTSNTLAEISDPNKCSMPDCSNKKFKYLDITYICCSQKCWEKLEKQNGESY